MARNDIDAALVLNSDDYHPACTVATLEQAKQFLIEKPMRLPFVRRRRSTRHVTRRWQDRHSGLYTPIRAASVDVGERINHIHIQDIIAPNLSIIAQAHTVLRPDDTPPPLAHEHADRMDKEAIGNGTPVKTTPEDLRLYGMTTDLLRASVAGQRPAQPMLA